MTMKRRRHNDDHQNYLLYFECGFQKGEQNNFLKILTDVKHVKGYRARWAKYESKRNGPSQCSRCLQFGHGERGCYKLPICFRCSEQHESKNCAHISKEINKVPAEKLRCHFCGEQHTAVNQKCNVRKQIIEKWTEKSKKDSNPSQKKLMQHPMQSAAAPQKSSATARKTSTANQLSRIPAPFVSNKQHNDDLTTQKPLSKSQPSTSTKSQQKKKKKKKSQQAKTSNLDVNKKQQPSTTVDKVINPSTTQAEKNHIVKPSTSETIEMDTAMPSYSEIHSISIEETSTESSTSKFINLLNEMMTLMKTNPACIDLFQESLGLVAKNIKNNHGL
jgi:hypothetical protein